MALPSSGAISMSMVKTEFSSSQTANLSLKGFGAALGTPVTSNIALAASFYGQSSGVSVTAWTFFSNGGDVWEEAGQACSAMNEGEGTNVTRYHDGSGTYPANGDTIYNDNPGTSTANEGIYAYTAGRSGNFSFAVSNVGVVSEVEQCE